MNLHGERRWRAPSACTPALESSGNVAYILVAQGLLHHVTPRHLGVFGFAFPIELIKKRKEETTTTTITLALG